jgi:hypothetical protein
VHCRFIVDGVVPHGHFCSTVRQRTAGGGSSSSSSNGSSGSSSSSSGGYETDSDADVCAVPRGTRERFIFMRGVQWSAHDIDSVSDRRLDDLCTHRVQLEYGREVLQELMLVLQAVYCLAKCWTNA